MLRFLCLCFVTFLVSCASNNNMSDRHIRSEMIDRHIPGLSFVVVKNGAVVNSGSYGLSNLELNSSASDETVYAIGSITKSFTAIVVLKLAEQGKIDLDQSILSFVPSAPENWRSATIRHLLSNTSGIPDFIDRPCPSTQSAPFRMEDAIAEAACLPLIFEPGERFDYSNTNFILLSMAIENVTGVTLESSFDSIIFDPIGMDRTLMVNYDAIIANRADGYQWSSNAYQNIEEMDPAAEAGAGGILSTVEDMAKFVLALGDERLLSTASWDLLWTPYPVRQGETPYAHGFGVSPYQGRARIGHNGAASGFASAMTWFPSEQVGVVVLSNGYEQAHGRSVMSLANEIASHYFD